MYEQDECEFHQWDEEPEEPVTDGPLNGKIVRVKGFNGIACRVAADDGDGRCVVVMVGDDRKHVVDADDCVEIAREAYCGECGQMGCGHDGLERE